MRDSVVPSIEEITPKAKLRRQIHVSGINMANDCGQRFLFRYILGIKSPPNAFLLVGKSTDESVTRDLDHKIETGELLQRDDVLEISAAKFEQEQKNEPIELEPEEAKAGKSLEQVLGEAKDKAISLCCAQMNVFKDMLARGWYGTRCKPDSQMVADSWLTRRVNFNF